MPRTGTEMTKLTIDELEMLNPEELWKLLLDAIHMSHPDIQYITDILDVGCPIDIRDMGGNTSLHWAAWNGKLEVVKLLVSRGVELNARQHWGCTALDIANIHRNLEVIKFLKSVDLDIHTRNGNTWARIKSLLRKLKRIWLD